MVCASEHGLHETIALDRAYQRAETIVPPKPCAAHRAAGSRDVVRQTFAQLRTNQITVRVDGRWFESSIAHRANQLNTKVPMGGSLVRCWGPVSPDGHCLGGSLFSGRPHPSH